ncbi:unnamed protein product [Mytilus edulis]|uniref:Uncharacterized protein n=1 Tax=Mytilus edulis TaxID=6550 RepID=A0A8S3SLH0_MYTED|nr:unnamed protein product [Mytilus edulis]
MSYNYQDFVDIADDALEGTVTVRLQITCETPVEYSFYASTLGRQDICAHCGASGAQKDQDLCKKIQSCPSSLCRLIYGIITFNPMSKDLKRKRVECPSSSDEELDLVFNTPEKKFKTIIVKREKPEVKIIKDPFALRYMQKNEELRIENINLRSENKDLVSLSNTQSAKFKRIVQVSQMSVIKELKEENEFLENENNKAEIVKEKYLNVKKERLLLKRKLERALNKSENNKKFKNECSKLSVVKDSLLKECNSLRASVEKLKSLKTQYVEMCNEMKSNLKNKELECLELKNENSDMLDVLNDSIETIEEAKNTLDDTVSENNDLKVDNDYLTALLHDDDEMVIETWNEEKQTN